MNDKVKWSLLGAAFLLVLNAVLSWGTGGKLGATWAGGTSHTNSQFDAVGGFAVNGTTVISSSTAFTATSIVDSGTLSAAGITNSGTMTVGGGTAVAKAQCATSSFNPPSLASNATTTFDMALTGASSSFNQTYSAGWATSTASAMLFSFMAHPSSTDGQVTVLVQNVGGSTVDLGTSTLSVCYTQF